MLPKLPKLPKPNEGDFQKAPDEQTRKNPVLQDDFTGQKAGGRVLHLKLGFLTYGTNDQTHAASIFFTLILLIIFIFVSAIGYIMENSEWSTRVFEWVSGTLLFVLGIAIGSKNNN